MVTILYEDEHLIAVDKPAGIATIRERNGGACLMDRVEAAAGQKLFIVHRLDKDVSGVVVFARDAATHRHLNMAFESRDVSKHYLAVVHGEVAQASFTIDRPIRQFGSGRMGVDDRNGKPSTTHFRVSDRLDGFTVVDAMPITGRRHQIRVHLYAAGHPIAGDRMYGDRAEQERIPRLMLHAVSLSLPTHEGAMVQLSAPLPSAIEAFIDARGRAR